MAVSREPSHLWHMQEQALADSRLWFPRTAESVAFFTLALAGEVGELANIIKKIERGSLDPKDPVVRRDVAMEVADVFTYTLVLAGVTKLDLEKAYDMKRAENAKRFGPKDMIG